jgi:hypothetical protein
MNALAAPDRERLVKLCGLFASSFAGERDAAVLAAMRFLRERKLIWDEVIAAPANFPPERGSELPEDWRGQIAVCLRSFDFLTSWERRFIVSLRGFRNLSPKQRDVLHGIASKITARAAA